MVSRQEGYIDFKGYKTYYVSYGDLNSKKLPLLVLHGGPGYPHYYLENLQTLGDERAIIFYDQLGCGQSDRPDNPKLWTAKLFLEELDTVRQALGLHDIHLLGHSWGGELAIDYMLTKPEGIHGLVLASPVINSQLWTKEAERLEEELGPKVAATMRKHELGGTTDSKEYRAAYNIFTSTYVCRVKPSPPGYVRSNKEMGFQVYETMWGPSETRAVGNLKDWNSIPRLHEITNSTLLTSGKYDEATPAQIEIAHREIKGSQWELFENSSHCSHLEEPEKYEQVVRNFLHKVENG